MAVDVQSEFKRPLPVVLLVVALLGWAAAIYFMMQVTSVQNASVVRIQQLELKVNDVQAALDKASRERDAAANQLRTVQQSLDKAGHDRDEAANQLRAAQVSLDKAGHDRDDALAQVAAVRQQVTQTEAKATEMQTASDKLRQERDDATKQLEAARQQMADAQAKLTAMQLELTKATAAAPPVAPTTGTDAAPK